MGWYFQSSLEGHAGPRAYLDAQHSVIKPELKATVLKSSLVSMRVYYAAVEMIRPGRAREVVAIVCLVKYSPRSRDGQIFGYKPMDEMMGPYESSCPAAILDLLTPTENASALEWRGRCRAALQRLRARPTLRHGATVVFAEPISFRDGRSFDRLTIDIDPRRPRCVRFRTGGSGTLYRISRLKDRDFHIEP